VADEQRLVQVVAAVCDFDGIETALDALKSDERCAAIVVQSLQAAEDAVAGDSADCDVLIIEETCLSAVDADEQARRLLERVASLPLPPEIFVVSRSPQRMPVLGATPFKLLRRPIQADELRANVHFAARLHRLRGSTHRARELERLLRVSLPITSTLDRIPLLRLIIREAVGLLKATSGGIHEYSAPRAELEVIAEFDRLEHKGIKLKVGEGLAGRLVETQDPFRIVDDYSTWWGRAEIFDDTRPFGAVLGVLLRWQHETLGVLYVDDEVGRQFSPDDAALLGLFADQASIALINSALVSKHEARRERLRNLATTTREIMADLRERTLVKRLDLIARYVAEVTGSQMAGVMLVRSPGVLVLEASHGHREGAEDIGRTFQIISGLGTGLTGAIAYEGKLVSLHGDALTNHPAVKGKESASEARVCHSLLAIPLKRRMGEQEILVGLLKAENKKGSDGEPGPLIAFDEDDEDSIRIFAEAVVVALDISEKTDWLNRLVDSSPDGVVAIDLRANVTLFNTQAEEILEYSRAQAKTMKVFEFYGDPEEPRRIQKALDAPNSGGRVTRQTATLRSRTGVDIPIRHSSTWLLDSRGVRVGSVGYFEDWRAIEFVERRFETLLKANVLVARATKLTDGLRELLEMMAALMPHTYCRILLMDEEEQELRVQAVRVDPREEAAELGPALWQSVTVAEWPGLAQSLEEGTPRWFLWSAIQHQDVLERVSNRLKMPVPLADLLIVPLRLGGTVGMIEFGETPRLRRPFTLDEVDFASQIASHTTVLIDRMRLYQDAERRGQQLKALDEASRTMRAEREPKRLFEELVRLAVELVAGSGGALFVNRSNLYVVKLVATFGIQAEPGGIDWERTQDNHEGLVGRVVTTGKTQTQLRWNEWDERDPLLLHLDFVTAAAVPLRFLGEVEAVLFVGDATGKQRFREDLEVLERFAAQAAIALHFSTLMSPEVRGLGHLRLLHKLTNFTQILGETNKVHHAMLTGITAGFGLGFNRAALLLLDGPATDRDVRLVGHAAIGELEEPKWKDGWEKGRKENLDDFEAYCERLEKDPIPMTTLWREIPSVTVPLKQVDPDPLSAAVNEQRLVRVPPNELGDLPEPFRKFFQAETEVLIVPLAARGDVRGVLVVDNKFTTAKITDETVDSLLTFVGTFALTLESRRLLEESKASSESLKRLFELSSRVVAIRDPDELLRTLIEELPKAAGASSASIVLTDGLGLVTGELPAGEALDAALTSLCGPALQKGHAEIEDSTQLPEDRRPTLRGKPIAAAICVPLRVHRRELGWLWLHYGSPRRFRPFEIGAMQLFASQVAVAYDGAVRFATLVIAVQQISRRTELREVMEEVVVWAREISGADAVALWPFDPVRQRFTPDEAIVLGIVPEEFHGRRSGGAEEASSVIPAVESFSTIELRVEEEDLQAVLYIRIGADLTVAEGTRELLTAFANQAALSISNARVLDRVSQAKKAAEAVAHVTTLEKFDETLQKVVDAARDTLHCSSIALFPYNRREDRWSYPPTHSGVRDAASVWPADGGNDIAESIVPLLMEGEEIQAGDVADSKLLRDRQFARDHGVVSCAACSLRIGNESVGVLFVNFDTHQRFTQEILRDIELFADQAALAIRNKHLFDAVLRGLLDFQHQIRTPIEMMHARVLELAERPSVVGPLAEEVATIASLSAKAKRVSNNIRLFSSLAYGQPIQADRRSQTVGQLVNVAKTTALNTSFLMGRDRGVRLRFDEPSFEPLKDIELEIDLDLFDYAVGNVLDNAFKYSYAHTTVTVEGALLPHSQFRLSICNRGLSILQEDVANCVQPGWQSEEAKEASREGRGLGLWIVSNIMTSLGGVLKIWPTNSDNVTEVNLILGVIEAS